MIMNDIIIILIVGVRITMNHYDCRYRLSFEYVADDAVVIPICYGLKKPMA